MGPAVQWPGQPAFYLLRLSASGAEESLTRLAIAALPNGTAVTGLALSPDGSKLAVDVDTGSSVQPGLLEIRVYTLATGAFRTWSAHGLADAGATRAGSPGRAWTVPRPSRGRRTPGRSRSTWMNQTFIRGVRLLDTAAGGDDLITDSRLAVTESRPRADAAGRLTSKDHVSQCVTDSIISAGRLRDRLRLLDDIAGHGWAGLETTTGFIRYSTKTGKSAVLGVFQFKGQGQGRDISLYWVNSTGNDPDRGDRDAPRNPRRVINGEKFTPLPGITRLGAAAW